MKLKKITAVIIALTLIYSMCSCSESSEDYFGEENEPLKAKTAYMDWFGVTYDLGDSKVIRFLDDSDVAYRIETTFEDIISDYIAKEKVFAVLRVKCVSNINQRISKTQEHYNFALNNGQNIENAGYTALYCDFNAEVLEILEGDSSIAGIGNQITIDMPDIYLYHNNFDASFGEWENVSADNEMGLQLYAPGAIQCTLPRIGREYVILVYYSKDIQCYVADMWHGACELSSPKEILDFKKCFHATAQKNGMTIRMFPMSI